MTSTSSRPAGRKSGPEVPADLGPGDGPSAPRRPHACCVLVGRSSAGALRGRRAWHRFFQGHSASGAAVPSRGLMYLRRLRSPSPRAAALGGSPHTTWGGTDMWSRMIGLGYLLFLGHGRCSYSGDKIEVKDILRKKFSREPLGTSPQQTVILLSTWPPAPNPRGQSGTRFPGPPTPGLLSVTGGGVDEFRAFIFNELNVRITNAHHGKLFQHVGTCENTFGLSDKTPDPTLQCPAPGLLFRRLEPFELRDLCTLMAISAMAVITGTF